MVGRKTSQLKRGRRLRANASTQSTPEHARSTSQLGTATSGTRQSARLAVVKNSSPRDSELESDAIDVGASYMTGPSRWTLKEVAIPAGCFEFEKQSPLSHTMSSASSMYSDNHDQQHNYNTPGTSAAPTPAGLALNRRLKGSPPPRASPRTLSVTETAKGKRKRNDDDQDQLANDIEFARALQQVEYEESDGASNVGNRRKTRTSDSENDLEDNLSDLSAASSFQSSFSNRSSAYGRSKQRKTSGKKRTGIADAVLPTRSAKSKASAALRDAILDEEFDKHESDDFSGPGIGSGIEDSDMEDSDNDLSAPRVQDRRTRMDRGRFQGSGTSRAERERAKLEHAHPEILTLWEDLRKIPTIIPEPAMQPAAITRKLKPFQLEGLDWMRKQEQSNWKGGLLGDEMGMGKTIQAVSLIMSDYPAKEPSLVIVPPVALVQWSSEIADYTNGKLKVLIHHNTDPKVKKLTVSDLRKYDVIMISYSGLESMYRKEYKGWKRGEGLVKENSRIHAIKYHRLILDEAHSIKSRTTGVAKACFALKARYKWCLSGTPVQNRIGEFFSLLRFLEVKPFASYFCKSCPCAELHWSQDEAKKCRHCHHSGFQHVSIFNQELLTPITQAGDPLLRKDALGKLRLITDRIMLRRMKRNHVSSMELPPKEVVIHNEFFGDIERDFSSSIMSNTTRQFDTYVSRGVMLNNYANIFGLIMQMRQVANHPDLILKKHNQGGQNVLICCICDEPAEEAIRSRCRHEFCRKCAKDYVRSFENELQVQAGSRGTPDCPRCHIPLAIDFEQPDIEQDEDTVKKNSIINRIRMEDWTSSTKIEMLIYDLYKLRSKKQTHKSIVFSQFTSMLQLVEWRLHRAGFNTVMLDGSMTPAQRQKSIEYFMKNVDVEVFLVSLKAGGVALNLTEASRVFIVDPWWNPAAEYQSADRCHRIGQTRPCIVTRLCIEDSVESRMVLLQEKKANMIAGTVDNDDVAMEKLTPEDMSFLFRGS